MNRRHRLHAVSLAEHVCSDCAGLLYQLTLCKGRFTSYLWPCPLSRSITKFYMQGACINNRDNDFFSPPDCSKNGGSIMDGSQSTCTKIFASSTLHYNGFARKAVTLSNACVQMVPL